MIAVDVTLKGIAVADAAVVASLTIRAGRTDVLDPPTSATCALSLAGNPAAWPHHLQAGDAVAIDVAGAPRFRGTITDLGLEWVDTADAVLSVTGAGNLATYNRRPIGYGAWPQEAWADRVRRVFAEAGVPPSGYLIDTPEPAFEVAARLAGETTVSAMFDDLSQSGGACIVDLPDGRVFVQALESRQAQAGDPSPLELDPSIVLYAPAWVQVLDVVNNAAVAYGPEESSATTSQRNTDSIALYGERSTDVGGTLATEDDADRRAAQIVNRRGYPRWVLPGVDCLGVVTPQIGYTVRLTELPTPTPIGSEWQPMVEGWTDQLDGELWTTSLALSDPVASGVTLPWYQLPPTLRWQDLNPACRWEDAYAIENLLGVP